MAEMTWECPTCWTKYKIDDKFAEVLKEKKDCKFCVRKDPLIPTTAEMDKLFTVDDMRNRFQIMIKCFDCGTWNQMHKDNRDKPCVKCDHINYDGETIMSLRSWSPEIGKRKKTRSKSAA